MAPIKFEEQLKNKLEQRSIQPSSDVWKQLSERLDENQEKPKNKGFWWLGVAAAIIGVLFALNFVFNSNTNSEIIEPTIVDAINNDVIETNELTKPTIVDNNSKVALELSDEQDNIVSQKETKNQIIKTPLKTVIKEKQKELILSNRDEAVIALQKADKVNISIEEPIKADEDVLSYVDQKVNEVVAQIQKVNEETNGVSNDEIDMLLREANEEIIMQKLYNEAIKTVDVEALLGSVEGELDQSFRDKVFKALKSGYKTVKTAVVERNN